MWWNYSLEFSHIMIVWGGFDGCFVYIFVYALSRSFFAYKQINVSPLSLPSSSFCDSGEQQTNPKITISVFIYM